MASLKLINNSGQITEKNICFVNTALQLLFSIPEVKSFFSNTDYWKAVTSDISVCKELGRIFQTAGHLSSAASLRILIANISGNVEMNNGTQQDITEFIRHLLQQIEIELSQLTGAASIFINKFWGKESTIKKFVNQNSGKCIKCNKLPREEEENFNILKLQVLQSSKELSLSSLIENSFSEGSDILRMKCSDCCPHSTNCPQSGGCKLKSAVNQRILLDTPDLLLIQLLRFENFTNIKTDTVVIPEETLRLPSGDRYTLVSIGDHNGPVIENGHDTA